MANLCISPVQAGTIALSTENSSLIFDLRLLSIKLCAVLRATFLPAALVADGCFRFVATVMCSVVVVVGFSEESPPASVMTVAAGAGPQASSSRGFICMILRDRTGGGGRAKLSSAAGRWAAEARRRDLTVLHASSGADMVTPACRAGGGSSKAICGVASLWVPSWPFISVDDAGVGGSAVRGILGLPMARTSSLLLDR